MDPVERAALVQKALTVHTTDTLVLSTREITPDELEVYKALGPGVEGHPGKMRVRHHRIAQLLAAGMNHTEVAEAAGVSYPLVSTLLASPAFQGLVREYLDQGWHEIEAVTKRARLAAAVGVEKLHARIEQKPDSISTRDLTNATLGLLDRGGIATRVNVNFGFSSKEVAEILRDAAVEDDSRIIEVTDAVVVDRSVGGRSPDISKDSDDSGTEGRDSV